MLYFACNDCQMSRIFNVLIAHKGKSYPALLTIAGDEKENTQVRIITNEERIQIILPNGSLSFSTSDVLKQLSAKRSNESNDILYVTENISLQLLNTEW